MERAKPRWAWPILIRTEWKMLFRPAVCSLIFRLREYFLMAVRKALLPSGGGNTSALDRPRTRLSIGAGYALDCAKGSTLLMLGIGGVGIRHCSTMSADGPDLAREPLARPLRRASVRGSGGHARKSRIFSFAL
jgi:hypothetical protein